MGKADCLDIYSFRSRRGTVIYGMAADRICIVAFQVVTADGRFVTASEESNPDLFRALRSGVGGTFGVVVSVITRVHTKLNVVTAGWRLDTFYKQC